MNDHDGRRHQYAYWRSGYIDDLTDGAIEVIGRYTSRFSSPLTIFCLDLVGGAVARVAPSGTAFPHRQRTLAYGVFSAWDDRREGEVHRGWTDRFWTELEAFATGAVYVNYLGREGEERVRAAYGPATYPRLAALKARWDTDNLFRANQNIVPNPTADTARRSQ